MKFSDMIRLIVIYFFMEIVDASEQAPLLLLFYYILEDGYYYLPKHVGEAITHILNDSCVISCK